MAVQIGPARSAHADLAAARLGLHDKFRVHVYRFGRVNGKENTDSTRFNPLIGFRHPEGLGSLLQDRSSVPFNKQRSRCLTPLGDVTQALQAWPQRRRVPAAASFHLMTPSFGPTGAGGVGLGPRIGRDRVVAGSADPMRRPNNNSPRSRASTQMQLMPGRPPRCGPSQSTDARVLTNETQFHDPQ